MPSCGKSKAQLKMESFTAEYTLVSKPFDQTVVILYSSLKKM